MAGWRGLGRFWAAVLVLFGIGVGVVQIFGKNTTLTIGQARDVAVLMDDRALGKREPSIPTAVPTPLLLPTVGP